MNRSRLYAYTWFNGTKLQFTRRAVSKKRRDVFSLICHVYITIIIFMSLSISPILPTAMNSTSLIYTSFWFCAKLIKRHPTIGPGGGLLFSRHPYWDQWFSDCFGVARWPAYLYFSLYMCVNASSTLECLRISTICQMEF